MKLKHNSIDILTQRFENLLLGLDTQKEKYTSDIQKQATIRNIKSFVKLRLEEKQLEKDKSFWKLLLQISKLDFENIKQIQDIYSKLIKLNKNPSLRYPKQKDREAKP